jgi:predicted TIM-barrel fold metal-dependent hydrolase
MTARPTRVVDAHVHLWDPARTDWYPYLSGGRDLGMGDVSGMARPFDVATYLTEAAGWNVEKLVNVAAATGRHCVDETLAIDERAETDRHIAAIVGGIPPADSVAEAIAMIDAQLGASRLRGLRPMGAGAPPVPEDDVLRAVHERGLLFELMAHPDQLRDAAARLEGVDDLVVVVEHAGWPRSGSAEEHALWKDGIDALAALGERVVCKLSGLAMPLGSMRLDDYLPWLDHAVEAFGTDRCLFASNFPVDGLHGTFDDLYSAFAAYVAKLDADASDKLFAANAERVYAC